MSNRTLTCCKSLAEKRRENGGLSHGKKGEIKKEKTCGPNRFQILNEVIMKGKTHPHLTIN